MSVSEFFIIIKEVDAEIEGHAIRHGKIDKEMIAALFSEPDSEMADQDDGEVTGQEELVNIDARSPFPENFIAVERSFSQAMLMYRRSVLETIKFAPFFASIVLKRSIETIASSRGTKRDDLSMGEIKVYSLPSHAFGSIRRHTDRSKALIEGSQHLPKISTIGIISSYDAILSDLLRVIFERKPEIIFTSDREVKFSELVKLGTIEAVRDNIVSTEIESVIRRSHHEQFSWMEKKFNISLREKLEVWPEFIELCERRNLLTHTGGVVSEQYRKNCEEHGKMASCQLGEKLDVDLEYLTGAINIVSEVGYKLIHTLWRKFAPEEREKADRVLNDVGMNLIAAREYILAENLLRFGVEQKQHSSDFLKRMMVVNLANAAKLSGNKERSEKALCSFDWSATSYQFQICVAAVRDDFDEVKRLLRLGSDVIEISPSDFRDWPVFRGVRKDVEVRGVFEDVFGEPLLRDSENISLAGRIPDDGGGNEGEEEDSVVH